MLLRLTVLALLAAAMAAPCVLWAAQPPTVNTLLGYKPTDKLLIVNADDAGMCLGANLAVIDGLENGLITSTTIMAPCPWFPHMAAYAAKHPEKDFGVHIDLTAEWGSYKWGPVLGREAVPKLCDKDGYLWPDVDPLYEHGDLESAYREAKAQIDRVLAAGVDVSHIDCHMGCLQYDKRYFEPYFRLAREYNLPLREAPYEMLAAMGAEDQRARERAAGILTPDTLIIGKEKKGEDKATYWKRILREEIKPGCTEIYIHPNLPLEDIKVITSSWKDRSTEHQLFTSDPEVRQIIKEQGIILIGYKALRDAQRKLAKQQ